MADPILGFEAGDFLTPVQMGRLSSLIEFDIVSVLADLDVNGEILEGCPQCVGQSRLASEGRSHAEIPAVSAKK